MQKNHTFLRSTRHRILTQAHSRKLTPNTPIPWYKYKGNRETLTPLKDKARMMNRDDLIKPTWTRERVVTSHIRGAIRNLFVSVSKKKVSKRVSLSSLVKNGKCYHSLRWSIVTYTCPSVTVDTDPGI